MEHPKTLAERRDINRRKSDNRIRKWLGWDSTFDGMRCVKNARQEYPWLCRWIADQHHCSCFMCNHNKRRYWGNAWYGVPIQEKRERIATDEP